MRMFFFVVGFLVLVLSALAAGMYYSDNQELKSQIAYANERGDLLNGRIERVVSVLPIEVVVDKGVVNMTDQEFDILVASVQRVADSYAEVQRGFGELDAQIEDLSERNSSLQAAYLKLAEVCEGNPQAQEVLRAYSCDSEEFHRCLKVVHGVYMYNYDTDRCGDALDERASCLENGGMTKYPTVFPSGT